MDGLTAPPAERTVFQDVHNGHMFVVLGSKRFRIQSEDREALGIRYDDVIGVPWGTYEWIASAGRYRSWLGEPLNTRLASNLALLHRPWPQQVVWLVVGAIIGG